MKLLSTLAVALTVAAGPLSAALADAPVPAGVRNVVIVPGPFVDGSGWRAVHDILRLRGYSVTVVQERFASLEDDVAAVNAAITRQDGPVVLVGHSYGGAVITAAGTRAKVASLVYVAAVQPEVGESTAQLLASMPEPSDDFRPTGDGHLFFAADRFGADFADDLTPNRTGFMVDSQVPATEAALGGRVITAGWHTKPSYGVVATEDHVISPDLQRWMYQRSGAAVTEVKASHAVYISQAEAVADVIETAATHTP